MISRRPRAALSGLAALVAVVGITFGANVWMAGGLCRNVLQVRAPSPDGKHDALVFARDCGAAAGRSTQVSIVAHAAELPRAPGDLFIANGGEKGPIPRGPLVVVTWRGPTTLDVRYEQDATIARKLTELDGVAAHYLPQAK